ncbi:ABC transporter ATP-binding protein [Tenuibacillus multivorans]|uniref:ABC-2 type transport system ATP-binding protein n=1 Tax=Tenuibacillus multivorans TaxID=237069 RepID=A0A1H0EWF9_9BACI|nr:ABC transporter ATP-binding protein [Tenuibacillus multivorans]GEL76929.1 ABC transporter ATP-binding protein [Tenuibacillus multivorans]SDN86724.1 ABC-2 type transport system ATP-binding protein [Tenuibacillus multivorans]
MLTLKEVDYRKNRKTLLSNVSGTIEQGDCITLFGPNGAGKSTLIKIMAGLSRPTSGQRILEAKAKNPIGYVPQQIAIMEGLIVRDQLTYYQKLTKQKSSEFVDEMIQYLGLQNILGKRVERLSGGMKRKVNLAVGLIHQPEILLLDEAFVGVDLAAKYDMLAWLKRLNSQGMTIVFITHDWDVVHHLDPILWILDEGRLLAKTDLLSLSRQSLTNGSRSLQKMLDVNLQR